MYKRIDDVQEQEISGYSFVDRDENEIFVELTELFEERSVLVGAVGYDYQISVYKSDIPKLIKALEAAYNHKD